MGRGTTLTIEQVAVIKAPYEGSHRQLISPLQLRRTVSSSYKAISRKRVGSPSKITPKFRHAIMRSVARNPDERAPASCLSATYQPQFSVHQVHQHIQEADDLRWTRIKVHQDW